MACVDDLIFLSNSRDVFDEAVDKFLSHFEGNSEPLEWYVGIHVRWCGNSIFVSQECYTLQAIDEFKLGDLKTYETPMLSTLYNEIQHHKSDKLVNSWFTGI